jgi:alkanesulfonate monooxygenase SsuD/methylene tetrahydromethanopterin reductase-like flavin-dependent oxidoreductase (luciferase family)
VDGRAGDEPHELDAAHRRHRRALPPAAGRADPAVRDAWKTAGHDREPRVSVSRSIFPIVNDLDKQLFWQERGSTDQVGWLDGGNARFGRTYAGEPDKLIAELAEDEAIAAADTLLLTVPNQLGVDYNAHVLDSVITHLAPELGWR